GAFEEPAPALAASALVEVPALGGPDDDCCAAGVYSLRLGASRLDNRPPFGDLGFLVGAERFRGLALARRNDKALVDKVLAHGGIVSCANGGGVELVDDVPRRALRGGQTRPQRELGPRGPRFLRRPDFGAACDAVPGVCAE